MNFSHFHCIGTLSLVFVATFMSRRRHINANYTKLHSDGEREQREEVDGFFEEQFQNPKRQFPWKAVIFIMGFMIAGTVCLTFGVLISIGFVDEKYEDRAWPFAILGALMLTPGGYYSYVLLSVCLKRDGFSLDDIPAL